MLNVRLVSDDTVIDPSCVYIKPESNTQNISAIREKALSYINLDAFILYYSSERQPRCVNMFVDIASIIYSLEDFEAAENPPIKQETLPFNKIRLQKIERALHKIFPELQNKPLNTIIVTNKSVLSLFPPLIKNTPFTSSDNLNQRVWALPFQITELFFRTLADFMTLCSLHLYGLINPDHAEYLKTRLSMTHNDSLRAICGNIYINFV